MLDIGTLSTPSWQCIHFTSTHVVPAIDGQLLERGIVSAVVDAPGATTASLLQAVSAALRFPDYFGENWDALDDCLKDMAWLPAAGCVLFVYQARCLWQQNGEDAARLLEAWLVAAEFWAEKSVPLHLVFVWERS
jgi:RNAse (barnase) inhibitor barstar